MKTMRRAGRVLREAALSAVNQRTASLLTLGVVMATALVVLLTTGRSVGAERAVLASIDDLGIRTVTFRVTKGAPLTADAVTRIAQIREVSWVGGLGTPVDAANARNLDGNTILLRTLHTSDLGLFGIAEPPPRGAAWVDAEAVTMLGLPEVGGGVATREGEAYEVAGRLRRPAALGMSPGVALVPRGLTSADEVNSIVVVAESPQSLGFVIDQAALLLGVDDPASLSHESNQHVATLRDTVQGSLQDFSRVLVIGVLAVAGVLEMALLYGFVMIRRKDFGRRRALGATRGLIVGLVVAQTGLLAGFGSTLGVVVALGVLAVSGDPWPGADFVLATWVLAWATGIVSSVVPAVIASWRDPLAELRVP